MAQSIQKQKREQNARNKREPDNILLIRRDFLSPFRGRNFKQAKWLPE